MDAGQDSTVQWLINSVVGLGILAFGWMGRRVNKIEDDNKADHLRIVDETRSNAQVMWNEIRGNDNTFEAFRQFVLTQMVTKGDIQTLKDDLLQAIRGR